jgi:hypothetical protein
VSVGYQKGRVDVTQIFIGEGAMSRWFRYLLPLFVLIIAGTLNAQQQFDVDAYREFLQKNENLTSEQLRALYSAGSFQGKMSTEFSRALHADSIDYHYQLTDGEKSLINQHGFMVTERLERRSFGDAFLEIYLKDLPVYVSTDAILHALHMSYDAMLMDVEGMLLVPRLDSLLTMLHNQLPALAAQYGKEPRMKQSLNDLDVYLTVPRILLSEGPGAVSPVFPENGSVVSDLLGMIKEQGASNYPLFATCQRMIDFSQFTPRGHYTRDPVLTRYFQAMIWLGRSEIYLIAPKAITNCDKEVMEKDVQRQTVLAALVHEATKRAGGYRMLDEIDGTIRALVGESDNVTLPNVRDLLDETGIIAASDLLDTETYQRFQNTLKTKSYAGQRILSQILIGDPMSPDKIEPASAFLLLGQRFVIDSYITANVVFDKVKPKDAPLRMLPSMLDVLFALGNNAAGQLLEPELKRYNYGTNLAGLRYLVDSYGSDFWNSTIYNGWLAAIRSLNPPDDRTQLPSFMRTAAWWQQKMNGQLASWAQLRHDNLLYAKQSYSGGVGCSFPKSLVEPVPEFYRAIIAFSDNAAQKFGGISYSDTAHRRMIVSHFENMREVAGKLEKIAVKELADEELDADEVKFLRGMIYEKGEGCTTVPDGWYPSLFYASRVFGSDEHPELTDDKVVADVHTAPTDDQGNMVGWVVHAGTGPINMMVVVCSHPDGESTAYIGPVMSYYEHISTNFKRLTDEEWKTAYEVAPSARPEWVWLYLAGKAGDNRSMTAPSLITSTSSVPATPAAPTMPTLSANVPNPFGENTSINFTIPSGLTGEEGELAVYTATGERVKVLVHRTLPSGNYSARWDGTDEGGHKVADGTYLYSLTIGGKVVSGKMTLVRGER